MRGVRSSEVRYKGRIVSTRALFPFPPKKKGVLTKPEKSGRMLKTSLCRVM